jgi:tetratricopeptide (TPR) repeat protein/putative methionine-R-sulfoxide reductase with GAF domain
MLVAFSPGKHVMIETAPSTRPAIGPYALCHELGEGAFSRVYSAEAPDDGRLVVLKVARDRNPLARERFRREFVVGTRLSHPHLGVVLDQGEDPLEGPYLVLAYHDGWPLSQDKGPRPAREVLGIGLQIARALTALAPAGLIHRDLTPANVIVDEHGQARLIDFGLMAAPAAANAAGTPLYMAPEALEGRPVDARADLYSLGALMYRLACGQAPFEGLPEAELLQSALGEAPPPIAERAPELGLELSALIMRMLAKDPADRPGSAAEVAAALARLAPDVARELPLGQGRWTPPSAWEAWSENGIGPGVNAFVGMPGMGRSRCLAEAQRKLRRAGRPALLVAGEEGLAPYELAERIWRWAEAQASFALADVAHEDRAMIAAVWPWAFPDVAPVRMGPQGVQVAKPVRQALGLMLRAIGDGQPALMIDDWHLVDASSRALLAGGFNREFATVHWLIGSPDEVAGANNWTLEPMSLEEVEAWLGGVLHGAPPAGLAERLLQAGEGNPGWMLQALRHLQDTGALDDPEAWDDVDLVIPTTLEPLLEAQWNRLNAEQRAIGELLALYGAPIAAAELESVGELLPASWQLELPTLLSRGLLVMQSGAYRFVHGAWPRWIRERTSETRRAHLAVSLGRALEAHWFPRGTDVVEREPRLVYRLASLFEQGDQPNLIARYSREAGQLSADSMANQEAVGYYERALEALERLGASDRLRLDVHQLRLGLADAQRWLGEADSAAELYERCLEDTPRPADRGRLLVSLGKCRQMLQQSQAARQVLEEAVSILAPLDDVEEHLRALTSLGRTYYFLGEGQLCMDTYSRAVDLATQHGQDDYRAAGLAFLGNRMATAPETAAQGIALLEQALVLRTRLGDRNGRNDTHMLLGNALMGLGRYREAKQHFMANLELARSFSSWQDEGYARINLAMCDIERGLFPAVLEHLAECIRLGQLVKDDLLVGIARFVESQARMQLGDFEPARRALEEGRALEAQLGSADMQLMGLLYEAEGLLHLGSFEAARLTMERAHALLAEGAGPEHAVHAALLQAEALMHTGKLEQAEERLSVATSQIERAGMVGQRAQACRIAGWLAWRQARPDSAKRAWEQGLAIATAEGLDHLESRLRLALHLVLRQDVGAKIDATSLERTCEISEKRRTPDILALACLALAPIFRKADQAANAERLMRRGRELFGLLTQALPTPSAREAFMAHPERRPFCEVGDSERIELLERRSRRLEMLLELGRQMVNRRDAKQVLEMARAFTQEVTHAERVLILLNPGQGELRSYDGEAVQVSQTIVGRVVRDRQALCVLDTLMDGELNTQASLLDLQVRAVMCVPMVIERTLHGVLYVDSRAVLNTFSEDDLAIVEAIAAQTAVALDNARMYALLQAQLNKK